MQTRLKKESYKNVFIASSALHLIYSFSTIELFKVKDKSIIFWFGSSSIDLALPVDFMDQGIPIIDCSHLKISYLSGYINNYNDARNFFSQYITSIDFLYSHYDTDFGFEIIRRQFQVPWRKIALIEDGIGNYFPHSMPKLYRQIPKSIISKLLTGFSLNITRHNVGGNKKLGIITTMDADRVYLHSKSNAEIFEIKQHVKNLLDGYKPEETILENADVLIFLPAVLRYGRLSSKEIKTYIGKLISQKKIYQYKNIVIKPHPKESAEKIESILKNAIPDKKIEVFKDKYPIEIYINSINPRVIMGNVSTSIMNYYILKDQNTKTFRTSFIITNGIGGGLYVKEQIKFLKSLIKDDLEIIEIKL